MKARIRSSLLFKALAWLLLHLTVLVLVFSGFVRWQLGLGLDSLLSGSAGERLRYLGEEARDAMFDGGPEIRDAAIADLGRERDLTIGIFDPGRPDSFPAAIPGNVLVQARGALPPVPEPGGGGERRGAPPWARRGGGGPPEGRGPFGGMGPPEFRENPPADSSAVKDSPLRGGPPRPVFLIRGDGGDGYWAGVVFQAAPEGQVPRHHLLLVRSERLDGGGMFFELKPWILGGLAVLGLSLAFWTPFMLGITRYLHRLTQATEGISTGDFQVHLPHRSHDELGRLGHSIQSMALRLDHLITGQKRFLGDAAHELCAPLARLRTGLGILEMKLGESAAANLAAIEEEVSELAALVEEILAFSRARNRAVRNAPVMLENLVRETASRERVDDACLELDIPPDMAVVADASLLGRAVANLLRNTRIHAGPSARVRASAAFISGGRVVLEITDDGPGPGVAGEDLAGLFEPFHRPDRSRARETGGSGLGLAIVRAAVEACGGSASAFLPDGGGFGVRLELAAVVAEES